MVERPFPFNTMRAAFRAAMAHAVAAGISTGASAQRVAEALAAAFPTASRAEIAEAFREARVRLEDGAVI